MPNVESALFEIGALERLALRDTPIHRLDARVKLLATLVFIATVISFSREDLFSLAPLTLFPVALAALGDIPPRAILTRLALAAPFAILVAIFNPLLERQTQWMLGPIPISAGWISFAAILLRFALSLSAGLILIATTGFDSLCAALTRLGAPRMFTVQLMLLYRYLFVLTAEATRILRAWTLRANGTRLTPRLCATLLGQLLLRALDRAHRVHQAMLARGFTGTFTSSRTSNLRLPDAAFLAFWIAYCLLVRLVDIPHLLGHAALGSPR